MQSFGARVDSALLGLRAHGLIAAILERNPMQNNFLAGSIRSITASEAASMEEWLEYCEFQGAGLSYLSASYDLFVRDTMREQMFFARHKRYRYSTYEEVSTKVYFDADYMRKYMYGLAVSTFLWPNHRLMSEYFQRTLPNGLGGRYLEVGPGHGFYMLTAMTCTSYDSYEGIDISPASVALTQSVLDHHPLAASKKYSVRQADFLQFSSATPLAQELKAHYDVLVMGEVLEHVEEPQRFLKQIPGLAHATTHIYLSTCINAPEIDHISLFRSIAQLKELFGCSGLTISDQLVLPYNNLSLEEAEQCGAPINVAFILKIV
jgi:SAM-dependent methyltransferase